MTDTDDAEGAEGLAAIADVAAMEHDWEHHIVAAIVGDERDDSRRQHLADAFRFHVERGDTKARFGPMLVLENGHTVPAPLAETADETCSLWSRVASHASNPRVRARLHDLLFERRWGDVGNHATAAVEAYLEVAGAADPPSIGTLDALQRAHELSRMTRRTDLQERCTAALIRAASASLEDPDRKPGVALGVIRVLAQGGCPDRDIDQLLARAREQYTDAWNTESTIALQRKRAPDADARSELDRELVELWLAEADLADPLVAVLHREKATKLARERGLPDLAEKAVLAMQTAEPPELARISVEMPSSITQEQIEEYLEALTADTWWDSMTRVISSGPPTGDASHNRQLAADLAREHPLQALFPKVRLGGDGLPRFSATTEADQFDDQLTDVETMAMSWHGRILVEAISRAGAKHSPSVDDVLDGLRSVGCTGPLASAIARVVCRFHASDFEAAAYTGLPLVERLCRELLLAIDAPLYRVQRERAPGTYPGLGALLPVLAERGLDESWHRFLRTFLSAPNGWNFRNEAMHGFVDDVGELPAGLVVMALLYLTLLQPGPKSATEEASDI